MKDAVEHTLQISTPTERDIVCRREFDAPRRLVLLGESYDMLEQTLSSMA